MRRAPLARGRAAGLSMRPRRRARASTACVQHECTRPERSAGSTRQGGQAAVQHPDGHGCAAQVDDPHLHLPLLPRRGPSQPPRAAVSAPTTACHQQLVPPAAVLRRCWAHPCHICAGAGLTPATSARGLGSPLPRLHRDWAHPCHICAGTRCLGRRRPQRMRRWCESRRIGLAATTGRWVRIPLACAAAHPIPTYTAAT